MRISAIISRARRADWQRASRALLAVFLAAVFLIAVPGLRPDPAGGTFRVLGYARDYLFDFVDWEARTLFDKAVNAIIAPQRYLPEDAQTDYVEKYLTLVSQAQQLEAHIYDIYSDPTIRDPEAASVHLRAERDALRAEQRDRQALAEAIVEDQVAGVLVEAGLGVGGVVVPPVAIRFTELPSVLIVSPRDRIERIGGYPLQHGITVEERERIETHVDAELDVSSLVTPIGGLAVWPAMLVETAYLPSVYDVAAHEWSHHYLALYPLGFSYGVTPELVTINETVANIVGTDIGWALLDRYYPDLAAIPPDYTPMPVVEVPPPEPLHPDDPTVFDFRTEMRETRVRVDELLAEGRVEDAEAYMEYRRQQFAAQGYQIRKLNQAYFAFHGSYADQPGATGADPIGPALRELRYYSGSLDAFIREVRGLTTFDQVVIALEQHRALAGSQNAGAH